MRYGIWPEFDGSFGPSNNAPACVRKVRLVLGTAAGASLVALSRPGLTPAWHNQIPSAELT